MSGPDHGHLRPGHEHHPVFSRRPTEGCASRWAVRTSVISELELLAYPGLTTLEGERVKAFLPEIAVVDLTPLVKTHAVEIRK